MLNELYITSDFFDEKQVVSPREGIARINGEEFTYNIEQKYQFVVEISGKDKKYSCIVSQDLQGGIIVSHCGYDYLLTANTSIERKYRKIIGEASAGSLSAIKISAPMPGLIKSVFFTAGQKVKKGETIFILEAMKMENSIKSPINGSIEMIRAASGDAVEKNFILCAITP